MTHGGIPSWSLAEGSAYSAGDVLCEIETDKAVVDFEAVEDGFLAKILSKGGTTQIDVGTPIAIISEEEKDLKELKALNISVNDFTDVPTQNLAIAGQNKTEEGFKSSPAAGLLLLNNNINGATISGTGKHGIITKSDVIVYMKNLMLNTSSESTSVTPQAKTAALAEAPDTKIPSETSVGEFHTSVEEYGSQFSDVPLTTMRKIISSRLTQSKQQNGHYYISSACDVTNANHLRKAVKAKLGSTFSLNDLFILASARSLSAVTSLNNVESLKLRSQEPTLNQPVDISVAVATESGLITPIVTDAGSAGLMGINSRMRSLAQKAREGKLKPEEYQGGGFTISNLGMFGINSFTAVINDPQIGILAVGGIKKVFKSKKNTESEILNGDEVEIRDEIEVVLSFNRAKICEKDAGEFLQHLQEFVSDPQLMQI